MKQLIVMFALCSFSGQEISAQEKCEIKMESIKGTYTGACEGGKAEGHGKSVGTDSYEGDFKNGYPDGKGKYIWQNLDYYDGSWKKGKMDGYGEMHYKRAAFDSVVKGYWKKDKYIGEYEKQFMVIANTSKITKVDCRLTDKTGADIMITIRQIVNSRSISSTVPATFINNITAAMGTYYTHNYQLLTNSSISRVQQVTFPFKAIFSLSNGESAEILFNEKGNYDVEIESN